VDEHKSAVREEPLAVKRPVRAVASTAVEVTAPAPSAGLDRGSAVGVGDLTKPGQGLVELGGSAAAEVARPLRLHLGFGPSCHLHGGQTALRDDHEPRAGVGRVRVAAHVAGALAQDGPLATGRACIGSHPTTRWEVP
jgi:hypothetical protein